jgi:sugar/nucleoside kinase (ribokinase family)
MANPYWKIPAIDVPAISPIGSGDAFAAGLASSLAKGLSVPDACLLASACAAAITLSPRLRASSSIEDVQKLEPLARVESW